MWNMADIKFPRDFYLDDVGVWRLKKEKIAEMEDPGPQTTEDWLRSCSTEQLAKVLYNFFMARTFCHICPEGDVCDIGYECRYGCRGEIEDFVLLLKQPHTFE